MNTSVGRIQEIIEDRLSEGLSPVHMEVENESFMHRVPQDSETHFRILVVSDAFEGRRQVQCHQAVYGLLKDLIGKPVHALALHTFGPSEWAAGQVAPDSPPCLGGSSADSHKGSRTH